MSDQVIRALFILKKRYNYGQVSNFQAATGMYNSAKFVADGLNASNKNITALVALANDNNDINALVHTSFPQQDGKPVKPTHVFIEGLWVVPSKFDDSPGSLVRQNPGVKWVVRIHSEIPFLAGEGQALSWIPEYLKRGVGVACNSPKAAQDIEHYLKAAGLPHVGITPMLPNIYPIDFMPLPERKKDGFLDIGCFGAIRPLKNQLQQAFWAVQFSQIVGLPLRFHINTARIEGSGDNVLRNIRAFFAGMTKGYTLVEHTWEDRESFLKTMAGMDLSMQVSFTESFNIISADAIYAGVPIVVSKEIPWSAPPHADPTNSVITLAVMEEAYALPKINVALNRKNLKNLYVQSLHDWLVYFGHAKEGLFQRLLDSINEIFGEMIEE